MAKRQKSLLASAKIMSFVATSHPARALMFYRDTLGLKLVSEDAFALAFVAQGTMLRVQIVQKMTPAGYTVLGWQVPDITAAAKDLAARGVKLERYEWMEQNALGVWKAPSGAKVGWFKDPDGNTLSITEI
jgi:catechol 2,3-dioxygenase-like lactoylglutathione lyase family enzyme